MREALVDFALEDENGYIRYIAAKHVSKPSKGDDASKVARYRKVQSDAAMIVRSAADELDTFHLFSVTDKPDQFWKRPHTKRLALVSANDDGAYIAELLRYAAKELRPNDSVTLYETADVLLQFLGPHFAKLFAEAKERARFAYEPYAMYSLSQTVESLWKLFPDIPELSSILLAYLPEPPYSPIPPEIIESMSECQLGALLRRDDIVLKDLRRKIFTESGNRLLRESALNSYSFELLDSDLTRLIPSLGESEESINTKIRELAMLAQLSPGATLVQRQAICDVIEKVPSDARKDYHYDALHAGGHIQSARAKRLSAKALTDEVLELRLYALAQNLSPSNPGITPDRLPEKLQTYQSLVVAHNPWQTYLNMRKAMPPEQWKRVLVVLPSVYIMDFDLPEEPEQNPNNEAKLDAGQLFDRINGIQAKVNDLFEQDTALRSDLVNKVQSMMNDISEQKHAELSTMSSALIQISTQMKAAEASTGRRVDDLHAKLKLMLWLVGVLLLLLVLKIL